MQHAEYQKLERLSKKYDETNVPLYVSYPTTAWWKNKIAASDFVRACRNARRPFLYFHFPYCRKACYYCCCYKSVPAHDSDLDDYLDRIILEYNRKLDAMGVAGFECVTQMHWGGGTPTYMTEAQLERVFTAIAARAEIDKSEKSSISLEAYPDDKIVTRDKLKLLRELGFNEISFGIQDFDERIQNVINRDCNPAVLGKLVEQSKTLGFRVHVDLCYGLPFQGQNEFERTVKEVLILSPDRVAVFPYAHYPLVFPAQRVIPGSSLPNSFIKVLLALMAEELFIENGYRRVGSDHFVRQNNNLFENYSRKCIERDFMGYSVDRRKEFIGFGNSAISFLENTFFHNLIPLNEYSESLAGGGIALNKNLSHTLSSDDIIRKRVILKHILTDLEIDKADIEKQFPISSFDDYFQAEMQALAEFEKDGLVENGGPVVRLTPYGVLFSRHIARVFDRYY